MITIDIISDAQNKWGEGNIKIGSLKDNEFECIKYTTSFLNEMYDFENKDILFKLPKPRLNNLDRHLKRLCPIF